MRPIIFLLGLSLFVSCTDDNEGRADAAAQADAAGNPDATTFPDAAETFPDAALADAVTFPDAAETFPDAAETFPDAAEPDAGEDDAGLTDAGFLCGTLGDSCGPNDPCVNQLMCSDPGNACIPEAPPMCGGFANQPCPNPATQLCLYYQGTDYGACFSRPTVDCICAKPAGQAAFFCP